MRAPGAPWFRLTVLLPLGAGPASAVWLVRDDSAGRLLRLKTWHTAGPEGVAERVDALTSALAAWGHPWVSVPLAAWTDETGRPVVLSDFTRGVTLRDALDTGMATPARLMSAVALARTVLEAAHARGLAHGSAGAGNLLLPADGRPPQWLDFGVAIAHGGDTVDAVATDRAAVRALEREVAARLPLTPTRTAL